MITIELNGRALALPPMASLADAVAHALGAPPPPNGVAVALNGALVPRVAWAVAVVDGDVVDVVRATAGG